MRRTCVRDRPVPARAPPMTGRHDQEIRSVEEHSSRRAGSSLAEPSPTQWVAARLARSHASRSARLAAYGGWKGASVASSPEGPLRRCWPGHGISRGSSYRGARYPFDHRTWRAAEARGVRTPVASVAQEHLAGRQIRLQGRGVQRCVHRPGHGAGSRRNSRILVLLRRNLAQWLPIPFQSGTVAP